MRFCPVCTSRKSHNMYEVNFVLPDEFPLNTVQIIKVCDDCGMVFSDSGNNQTDFDNYYSRSSKYTSIAVLTTFDQQRFKETFNSLKDFMSLDSAICDLGCGGGGLLSHLHSCGYKNLTGIDGGELIQEKFNFIRSDLFSFSDNLNESFDLVICTGVIEHVYEIDRVLRSIHVSLKDNGFVYIEVPDASRYFNFVTSPFQDFNIEHINHFSERTLINLLQRSLFEIVQAVSILQQESEVHKMPVIRIMARKSDRAVVIQKDNSLRDNIYRYIELSENMMLSFEAFLSEKLENQTEVYIWGVGQLTLKLLGLKLFTRIRIAGLVDRNPIFSKVQGISVEKPTEPLNPEIPIIIGSTINAAVIKSDIETLGLNNLIIELEISSS